MSVPPPDVLSEPVPVAVVKNHTICNTTKKNKYCAVFGCLNNGNNKPHLSLFSLPADDDSRMKWLELISRDQLKDKSNISRISYVVCEEHFDPRCILMSSERKRLIKHASPSLNLPARQHSVQETQTERIDTTNKYIQTNFYSLMMTDGTQTPNYLVSAHPSVSKLKEELSSCKKRLRTAESCYLTKETFHKLCDKFLTKSLAEIVKAQTKLKHQFSGNRYTTKYKQFCTNLYYTSPHAYKLLEQALCLPSAVTLTRNSLSIGTEVNEHLLATLKVKVKNMTNSEKVCSVVVDTISLKANLYYNVRLDKIIGLQEVNGVQSAILAKNALVVMIRGLFGNWRQPIAYALLGESKNSEELSNWIEELLEKLIEVGLDIRVFVSNLEMDMLSDEKKTAVTTEKPYFFIKNRKVYHIIDALHLVKSLRNNLMSNDFHFQGSVAKYEHILQFYEGEKHKSLKLAPKLSDNHVKPNKHELNEVHYATELLSHTVATAISCYIDFKAIDESAKDTVKFIKVINDLFDILNSSTTYSECEYRKSFAGSAAQVKFMNDMLHFFRTLKLINPATGHDVTSTAKFIQGFQFTITSILLLFDDLRLEGYKNLLTRRLNQDVADIFFDKGRNKLKKPTTRQFLIAFKKHFFANIMKSGKQGKGVNDLSEILVNTEKLGQMLSTETLEDNNEEDCNEINTESSTPFISSSEYCKLELPEENQLRFITDYLLKKCLKVHGDCQLLKSYLEPDDKTKIVKMDIDDDDLDTEDLPLQPYLPNDFLIFVEEMEKNYQNFFNNHQICSKVARSIYEAMNLIAYNPPCACFPISYVKKLFVRIRIYITVKHNNEDLRKHKSAKMVVFRSSLVNS